MIAVLDYGIGNLRSAQKALERVGADAVLTDDAGRDRGPPTAWCSPAWAHFGRCMEALREAGLEDVAREAIEAGTPVPRHLRRHADALRRLRGGPRRQGHGRAAGHGPAACPTG